MTERSNRFDFHRNGLFVIDFKLKRKLVFSRGWASILTERTAIYQSVQFSVRIRYGLPDRAIAVPHHLMSCSSFKKAPGFSYFCGVFAENPCLLSSDPSDLLWRQRTVFSCCCSFLLVRLFVCGKMHILTSKWLRTNNAILRHFSCLDPYLRLFVIPCAFSWFSFLFHDLQCSHLISDL